MVHLLTAGQCSATTIQALCLRAQAFQSGAVSQVCAGKTAVFITDRPSLRTRASFTLAVERLGGQCHNFLPSEIGFGQRESVQDIAGVLGRYYHLIIARIYTPEDLVALSQFSGVPVINALSQTEHPAQALSDIFTIWQHFHEPTQLQLVYVGDASNTARSLMLLCATLGWQFTLIGPKPDHFASAELVGRAECVTDMAYLAQADVVYTDTWVSMGQEAEATARNARFAPYYLTAAHFATTRPQTIFMNDMPIRRGVEIDDAVVDSPRSIIYQQAENRIYMQMAIIEQLMTN